MDVFDLRRQVVDDYATFTRSFTRIKADDLRQPVDAIYANDRFWPEPLLQISPHFQPGASVEELSAAGEIEPMTARIFRVPEAPAIGLRLHTHQQEALTLRVARAKAAILQCNAGLTRDDTPDAALDQSIVLHSGDSTPAPDFCVPRRVPVDHRNPAEQASMRPADRFR